ncbi:MAG: patatin-like phospholipase family protein, partial [Parasutterella excrementihominis]
MKVGLALGSGSARGFSHIGIIDCLLDQGIVPDVVAGTSIGAIVGACYVSGHLERLRKQALAINRLNWTTFFNPSFSIDGWINLHQMQMFLVKSGVERKQKCIEDLKTPFGTVT